MHTPLHLACYAPVQVRSSGVFRPESLAVLCSVAGGCNVLTCGLHLVAKSGHVCWRRWMQYSGGGCNVLTCGLQDGHSALHLAAKAGHVELVQDLVTKSASGVNLQDMVRIRGS
jgi:ankyrin repeat protein